MDNSPALDQKPRELLDVLHKRYEDAPAGPEMDRAWAEYAAEAMRQFMWVQRTKPCSE